jgi:hypothetical protein
VDIPVEQQRKYGLAALLIAVTLLIGGYFIGNAGGANIEAAEAAGDSAGAAAGAKAGKKSGYNAGYKKGYRTSYKAAYAKAVDGD